MKMKEPVGRQLQEEGNVPIDDSKQQLENIASNIENQQVLRARRNRPESGKKLPEDDEMLKKTGLSGEIAGEDNNGLEKVLCHFYIS